MTIVICNEIGRKVIQTEGKHCEKGEIALL